LIRTEILSKLILMASSIMGDPMILLLPVVFEIGTAELYGVVENIEGVSDSLVVSQNYDNDVRMILFFILAESTKLEDEF
jgi:acetoacetyl-CoA synthetase